MNILNQQRQLLAYSSPKDMPSWRTLSQEAYKFLENSINEAHAKEARRRRIIAMIMSKKDKKAKMHY